MSIKRLEVKEFTVTEKILSASEARLKVGGKFAHFQDPVTKKFYRPKAGFTVTGEDLDAKFEEIPAYNYDNE